MFTFVSFILWSAERSKQGQRPVPNWKICVPDWHKTQTNGDTKYEITTYSILQYNLVTEHTNTLGPLYNIE